MEHPGPDGAPSVDSLKRFLKDDDVVGRAWRGAADAAGVSRAEDLLVVDTEDLARLAHLDLDSLSMLREAFARHELVVARLLAEWRRDSKSAITLQELLWALTYVLATENGDAAERISTLVSGERWWQRATPSHRSRFLEGIVSQLAAARGIG